MVLGFIILALTNPFYHQVPLNAEISQDSNFTPLTREGFLELDIQEKYSYLEKLTGQKGLKSTWSFIVDTYQNNPGSGNVAHDLAHFMGGLIFDKSGFSGLSICSPTFAYGCFHGFLDKAFYLGTEKLSEAEQACNKLGPQNSGPVASCVHGIGHGLASFHKVKDLEASLKECNKLINNQQFCYDGVFMEFERSASTNFYNQEDPLSPCNKLPEIYDTACGRNQPMVMIRRFGFVVGQVAEICNTSTSEVFKEACFDSLGSYSVLSSQADTDKIISLCKMQPLLVNFQKRCLRFAAGEMVFQDLPNWRQKSEVICRSLENQDEQIDCMSYIHRIAQDYQRN